MLFGALLEAAVFLALFYLFRKFKTTELNLLHFSVNVQDARSLSLHYNEMIQKVALSSRVVSC